MESEKKIEETLNYIRRIEHIYRRKWKESKGKPLYRVYPEIICKSHLIFEMILNVCEDIKEKLSNS
jgi:hypothetical protein